MLCDALLRPVLVVVLLICCCLGQVGTLRRLWLGAFNDMAAERCGTEHVISIVAIVIAASLPLIPVPIPSLLSCPHQRDPDHVPIHGI